MTYRVSSARWVESAGVTHGMYMSTSEAEGESLALGGRVNEQCATGGELMHASPGARRVGLNGQVR